MSLLNYWENTQAILKEKIGGNAYGTWISPLGVKENQNALIFSAPDEFFKNWIEEHYKTEILYILSSMLSEQDTRGLDVIITVDPTLSPDSNEGGREAAFSSPQASQGPIQSPYLNARFSFDNFVIGPSNHFAFAACKAVAESPAKSYNPLFLYSPSGLGKTHLMQSITHEIQKTAPHTKCCYLPSETFTNELISAIQHRSTDAFRQKYRTVDVLLIDDIHFIAGKEATQEEFFHTFNALHNGHKQIIISSDRPPKEISNLDDRLNTRFTWGLVADIQPPDFETRVAILKKKLEREPVDVPEEVIVFIAEQIKTNIRELEGALIRVVAYSLLEEKPITIDITKRELKEMVKETKKTITPDLVLRTVSDFFQISITDMKSKKRNKHIILPRQVAMYLTRSLTKLSLPEIGQAFGGKDHTTILHAVNKIEKGLPLDKELHSTVEELRTALLR